MTEVSRVIGGKLVKAECAPAHTPLARDVLNVLAKMALTQTLTVGLRIRFGWSVLTLLDDGASGLVVCEPNFGGDPLHEVRPGLDATLEVIASQTSLARRTAVTPMDVGFEQFVVAARNAVNAPVIHLFRSRPGSTEDSGWSVTEPGTEPSDEEADFDALHVYQLFQLRPAALAALILPTGFAAIVGDDRVLAVLDPLGRDRLSRERFPTIR